MKLQKSEKSRRTHMEQLETRTLLAGDVAVAVVQGEALFRGDDLDNHLMIEAGNGPAEYVVTGLPDADNVATTVNGQASITISDVNRGMHIGLHQGNDGLTMEDLNVHGHLMVDMADGNDAVDLTDVRVARHAILELGRGEDSADVADSTVRGYMAIVGRSHRPTPTTGSDGTTIAVAPAPKHIHVEGTRVGGSMAVGTGSGADDVTLINTAAKESMDISTQLGDDLVTLNGIRTGHLAVGTSAGDDGMSLTDVISRGATVLRSGQGSDDVNVVDSKSGRMVIRSGRGIEDNITVEDTLVRGILEIRGGQGTDNIDLTRVEVHGPTKLVTGRGSDAITIVDSIFSGRLKIYMGAADDSLNISGSTVDGPASLIGGPGEDTLVEDTNQFLDAFFENFEL